MTTGQEECQYSTMTRLTGASENVAADVELIGGKNRLSVEALERADGLVSGAVTVGTTAVALRVGATNLSNRRGISVQNKGPSSIYIGSSSVATSTGTEIAIRETVWLAISDAVTLYAIAPSADQNVRIIEVS